MDWGQCLALIGAAIAAGLPCMGAARGVGFAGEHVAGAAAEKPDVFRKALLIQLMPSMQALLGLLIAMLALSRANFFASMAAMTTEQGLSVLVACLPVALAGLVSGICQGRAAAAAIGLLSRRPDSTGRGLLVVLLSALPGLAGFGVSLVMVLFIRV